MSECYDNSRGLLILEMSENGLGTNVDQEKLQLVYRIFDVMIDYTCHDNAILTPTAA